jgi:hypothetical protein
MQTQQGFLGALFDTRFGTLITPRIIRVLYILSIIALAIFSVIVIIGAFANSAGFGILTLLVLAPIGFLLYLILIRIYLELVIIAFKINENAHQIAANTGGAVGPPPPPTTPAVQPDVPQPPATA